MFKTELGRVSSQAVVLSVYALTALWGIPILTTALPDVPAPLISFGAIVLSSALLCTLWAVVSRTAWLKVKWTTHGDSKELIDVDVRIDPATKSGQEPYMIHVERDRVWGVGWLILRLAVRRGLWVTITAPHSSLVLFNDDSDEISVDEPPNVRSRAGCTIQIRVGKPVPEPERAWKSAYVRVGGKRQRPDDVATLYCTADAPGKVFGWICHRYIKVDTKALTITERWR
jgi:hypothetical protein